MLHLYMLLFCLNPSQRFYFLLFGSVCSVIDECIFLYNYIIITILENFLCQVRASAVFALGTLLDVGFDSSKEGVGGDEECDDDEKVRAEVTIVRSLLRVASDGSPLVRAEVAVGK